MQPLGKIHLGTCAWSFEDWRGNFYPPALPPAHWLEFYAQHFNTVEVDTTFHAVPTARAVEQWQECTPEHFRFCCQLPHEITHARRLRESGALLTAFLRRVEALGQKLGAVLIQLPPSFPPAGNEDVLRRFLAQLPAWPRFAIEFRDPGWSAPRITELLRQRAICEVWSDTTMVEDEAAGAFHLLLPEPTDLLYIRLLGDRERQYDAQGQTLHRYGQLQWPREESLENWALKIQRHLSESRAVYVMAANHFEGSAPHTARRLAARLGLSLPEPPAGQPAQLDVL